MAFTGRIWTGLAVLLVAATAAPLGLQAYHAGLVEGTQAPDFRLTSTGYENGTLGEPVDFTMQQYRNKTVLLDFMAIACTSCRLVDREVLEPIWEERRDDPDFVLISIDTWADPEAGYGGETVPRLIGFQEDHGHDWRHALDTDQVFRKYDAISIPKLAVIGPEGQIVWEQTGQPSLATVRSAIDRAQAGDAAAATVFRFDTVFTGTSLFVAISLVAGVASFFAPCSVGLIPAYLGFLLQGSRQQDVAHRTGRTVRAGVVTGAGIVTIYAAIAVLLWALAAAGADSVGPYIETIRPVMAGLLILFGALMLFRVGWDWLARRVGMGSVDGRRGFFAFGVGYGLAAFGCTGPIFLPTLVLAFAHGTATGLLSLAVYTLAVAGFVFLAALLVAGGHQTVLRRMLEKTDVITKLSAVLLIGAGAWLIWFDWRAGVLG